MKRFSKLYLTCLAALTVGLAGCSDDLRLPNDGPEQQYDGIVLRVPDVNSLSAAQTRTDATTLDIDVAKNEGKITDLWLIAFDEDGNKVSKVLVKDADDVAAPVHSESGYLNYDLTEEFSGKDAKFHIYLLANVPTYSHISDISELTDEASVKKLQLHLYEHEGENSDDGAYLLTSDNIANYGLPSACLPADMQYKKNGDSDYSSSDADGYISIDKNFKGVLHADLAFLCSKVRYTIFFDNTDAEGAKSVFGNMSLNLNSATASNVLCGATQVVGTADAAGNAHNGVSLLFGEKSYDGNASDYPANDNERKSNLEDAKGVAATASKHVYQGVAYLPENLATEDASRTVLSFAGKAINADGSDGSNLVYTLPLLPTDGSNSRDLERAHAYDIVANVKSMGGPLDIKLLDKQGWTNEKLFYSLQLPTYLDVDETAIALEAGEEVLIGYKSNAALSFESPKYDETPIYQLKAVDGKISVTVNPQITDGFGTITGSDKEKYNFFHVTAGNIRKKIEVDLSLKRYLRVGPKPITIDARERISSSDYSGTIDLTIETNVADFWIEDQKLNDADTKTSWNLANPGTCLTIDHGGENDATGTVNFASQTKYEYNTATVTKNDNRLVLHINYKDMNGGKLWQEGHTIKFTVGVPNDGYNEDNENYVEPQDVYIYIRPATDDYTIYFHTTSMDNPHIYVYQCLEFPASLSADDYYHVSGGTKTPYASAPIGFYNSMGNLVAALEYSFTGAIAFKGWDVEVNKKELKRLYNDENHTLGEFKEGFYLFPEHGSDSNWSEDYDVNQSDARYYRGTEVDFCATHRGKTDCDGCKNGTGNAGWPGVKMIYEKEGENAGWWKFTLSGVATPGKALIIFTNSHGGDAGNQTPGSGEPGLVLFGFPERVGYYAQDGNKTWSTSAAGAYGGNPPGPIVVDNNRYYQVQWKKVKNYDGRDYTREKIVFTQIPDGATDPEGNTVSLNTRLDPNQTNGNEYYFNLVAPENVTGTVKGYVCNNSGGEQKTFQYDMTTGDPQPGNTKYIGVNEAW